MRRQAAGISGVILVGGDSRRMGRDKALLSVAGRPLVQRVAEVLREVTDELLLVGEKAERYTWVGGRAVDDQGPGSGPLAGIKTALSVARHPYCLVVACDMPFLNADLLRYMLRQAIGWDAAVPRRREGLEPMHAVYNRSCLKLVEWMLENGELSPLDLFPLVRVRYLEMHEVAPYDPRGRSFVNLNTPADLALAGLWPEPSVEEEGPVALALPLSLERSTHGVLD